MEPKLALLAAAVVICSAGPALGVDQCIGGHLNPAFVAHSAQTAEGLRVSERMCQTGKVIEHCIGDPFHRQLNPAYVAANPELFAGGVREYDRQICQKLADHENCQHGVPVHIGMTPVAVRAICAPDEVNQIGNVEGHRYEQWTYDRRSYGGAFRYLTFQDGILTVIQGEPW
jgi:hypothetical protein